MKPQLRSTLKVITPAIAADYLTKNKANREIRPSDVKNYTKLMINGEFYGPVDPIIFDWDGVLINGQHRLTAIVNCGIAQEMQVLENMDPNCYTAVDRGVNKTAGDYLFKMGIPKEISKQVAGLTDFVIPFMNGKFGILHENTGRKIDKPTDAERLDFYAANKEIIEQIFQVADKIVEQGKKNKAATANTLKYKEITSFLYFLGFYNFSTRTYYEIPKLTLAKEFIEKIYLGIGVNETSSVFYKFRGILQDKKARVLTGKKKYAILVTIANAFFKGKEIKRLSTFDDYNFEKDGFPVLTWGTQVLEMA